MRKPIWIDTDVGFDDMAALAMVHSDPNWAVLGLGLSYGNARLDQAVAQAQRMRGFFGWRTPLHAGSAKPILGPAMTGEALFGPTGLRTIGRTLPDCESEIAREDAVTGMTRALAGADAPVTVLALGPLTNIAIALLARPELARLIERIVWMGGAAIGGNHTATTEFNAACDPEALAIVLESGVAFRMIGLECCRQVTITGTDAAKLRALQTERARILADLMDGYVRLASVDGSRPMPVYDAVAAAAVLDDRAVAFIAANISVERAGALTRGTTICEFRPQKAAPNAEIARTALATRVFDRLLADFTAAAVADPASDTISRAS
ncbi:MAG TPA: nucleoside hydrolase [Beijerinckiaceae bacterium]|nr:nucleoside hydrolase [Beijerinckiaceae bacterium]